MSQHRSFRATGGSQNKRSVLKRYERLKVLSRRGQWKEGQSVLGLPKTKPDA